MKNINIIITEAMLKLVGEDCSRFVGNHNDFFLEGDNINEVINDLKIKYFNRFGVKFNQSISQKIEKMLNFDVIQANIEFENLTQMAKTHEKNLADYWN